MLHRGTWIGIGLMVVMGASTSLAQPPTTQALLDRINALQDEVNQLKAQVTQPRGGDDAAATGKAAEIDAARHDNLMDMMSC